MEIPGDLAGALGGEGNGKLVLAGVAVALVALVSYLVFFSTPPTGELDVKVTNDSGQPLWSATVAIKGIENGQTLTTGTDGLAIFRAVPIGKQISVEASGKGFNTATKQMTLAKSGDSVEIALTPETVATTTARILRFIGPDGENLAGKKLFVSLSCSNGVGVQGAEREVSDGLLSVQPPSGCGALIAKVSASGFASGNFTMEESGTIRLQALDIQSGSVKVSALDSQGNFLDGIEVVIKDSHGVPTGDKKLTSFGDASFELVPGNYSAYVYDPALKFAEDEKQFSVNANAAASVQFTLSARPLATISVRVLDADSGAEIKNANVTLEAPSGKKSSHTFVEKQLLIGITEQGINKISASADGYAPSGTVSVDSAHAQDSNYGLRLARCTPATCGTLMVTVLDEDGLPVQNARVALLDSNTGLYMAEYGLAYTDYSGEASFLSVRDGSYKALVQKYPAQGTSDEFTFSQGQPGEVKAGLTIGSGTIEVMATDAATGKPVPFAFATLATDYNTIGSLPLDAQGKGSFATKADKSVFAVVQVQGYAPFTSPAYQIYPDGKISIAAKLNKEFISNSPSIELLGLFDDNGKPVDKIAAGGSYRAKFGLKTPSNIGFGQVDAFIRAGNEDTAQKDGIYIGNVNAPGAAVLMGSSYTGHDIASDNASVTNDDAKWASLVWGSNAVGYTEFDVQLSVRKSVAPGMALPVFYRAFAIGADGKYYRDPADAELGFAESAGGKDGMYAKAYQKDFHEGSAEECSAGFCYSERMVDLSQGLALAPPYNLKVFSDYEFSFSLTNNSDAVHDHAVLGAKNSVDGTFTQQNMSITNYDVMNADSQEFSSDAPDFGVPNIPLGMFTKNKAVEGKFTLRPEVTGDTALQLQMVSDQTIAFSRFVKASVVKDTDINVTVSPDTFPAFTDFDLNTTAALWNSTSGFLEVDGALVRVERTTPDRVKTVFTATTDGEGKAGVHIPASAPGTIIIVTAQKAGYLGTTVTREVSDKVVSFKPRTMSFGLNLTGKTELKQQLEATNIVPLNLKITGLVMGGNFHGLLDEARIDNWLAQYAKNGTSLPPGGPVQLTILSAISEDAKRLDQPASLDTELRMDVSNDSGTITWPLEVPVHTSIDLAEPPKSNGCLEVGLKDWKDATLGGKAEAEFTITNSCVTQDDKPLDLRNLQAQVKWKGNKLGNVELDVQDPDTGQEASQVLADGFYGTLLDSVPAQKQITALLTFTPKGGTTGQRAEFDVLIDAGQVTNAGEQLAGASNPVSSQIDIIDLSECIQYKPDAESGIVMQPGDSETTLQIDSSKCGNADIDFWLCKDNKGCSGGADGGILVKPDQFHLSAASPTKTVQVSRQEVPGMYGINVAIRTPRSNYREVANIDALIKPTANDAFSLLKYEFTVKGNGSQDSTELTNQFFVQPVAVNASICDWGQATETSWWNWTGAGVGAVMGAIMGMKTAMVAAHAAAAGVAKSAGAALNGAKAAGNTSLATTQASSTNLASLCSQIQSNMSAVSGVSTASTEACVAVVNPHVPAALASANASLTAANTECQTLLKESKAAEGATTQAIDRIGTASVMVVGATTPEQMPAALFDTPAGWNPVNNDGGAAYFSSASNSIVIPAAIGVAAAAIIIPQIIAHYSVKQTGITLIITKLDAASAALSASSVSPSPGCAAVINPIVAQIQATSSQAKSYSGGTLATGAAQAGTFGTSTATAGSAIGSAGTAIAPAAAAGTSLFTPTMIMGAYTVGGFFIGGVLPGLFGQDPCSQVLSSNLPAYMINLLSDAGKIDSGVQGLSAAYDTASARIIGNFTQQKIGVVFTNNGVSNQKPVYSTFTFNATQHVHANPTQISRGNSNFGPFNVPDQQTLSIGAKLHLKFKTQEPEETVPPLQFDTLSCVSGNKTGRTGAGALPKVKLNWTFGQNGIGRDSCLEQNANGVYCDATQFSIMLSRRLNSLKEFFDRNPTLACPANPLYSDLNSMTRDLNTQQPASQGCYISSWSGYLEGEPAIKRLIEANENNITWTGDIPNKETFMDTIHFNALLMQDGYTSSFMRDFAGLYTSGTFFDTPDWFDRQATDAAGKKYGIGRLFEADRVKLENRFFDSPQLSSAGTYEVLLDVQGDDGTFRFFNDDGSPNSQITVETYLLKEPKPSSVFYSMPFDGLVGLQGGAFVRQGYGSGFNNSNATEFLNINKDAAPVKTYNGAGSNPVVSIDAGVEKGFFRLNTSPSDRGSLLIAEKTGPQSGKISLSPSHATPVMMKATADTISNDNLAAYYTLTSSEVPVNTGNALTYWDGAGACLDPSGLAITQAFDQKADRHANSHDPVLNWKSAYAVDFGKTIYTGDAYIRTIIYTNPLEDATLTAEQPNSKIQLFTPDDAGTKVKVNGVSGVPYNNPSGGSAGNVQAVSDVFDLVKAGSVCVVDSGRKASFFWNPKAVYEMQGTQRNISGFTNSLVAGKTCIGFG